MARLRADLARILEREPLDLLTAALLLDGLEAPPGDPRTVETTLDTVAQDLQRRLQRAPPGRQRLVEAVRYLQRERGLRPVRPGEADPPTSWGRSCCDAGERARSWPSWPGRWHDAPASPWSWWRPTGVFSSEASSRAEQRWWIPSAGGDTGPPAARAPRVT